MRILILALSILYSLPAYTKLRILESSVEFIATGRPAFIKAHGTVSLLNTSIEIENNQLNGIAAVDLTSLDSGIELRDQHLKSKYLNTNKYPKAILVFENQKITLDGKVNTIQGKLKFHGIEKLVELKMEFQESDSVIFLQSSFDILLTQFGIELPSFQGITAANKVKLTIKSKVERVK